MTSNVKRNATASLLAILFIGTGLWFRLVAARWDATKEEPIKVKVGLTTSSSARPASSIVALTSGSSSPMDLSRGVTSSTVTIPAKRATKKSFSQTQSAIKVQVRVRFKRLYELLNLDALQIDQFEEILVSNFGTLQSFDGVIFGSLPEPVEIDLRDAFARRLDGAVENIIGVAALPTFRRILNESDIQKLVDTVEYAARANETPLDSSQREALISMLIRAAGGNPAVNRVDAGKIDWPTALGEAAHLLSPGQFDSLKKESTVAKFNQDYYKVTGFELRPAINGL